MAAWLYAQFYDHAFLVYTSVPRYFDVIRPAPHYSARQVRVWNTWSKDTRVGSGNCGEGKEESGGGRLGLGARGRGEKQLDNVRE